MGYRFTPSIFLSIELQSYGLYILSTIYRNSELSTTGGLIWATARVYLRMFTKEWNGTVESTKDYWSYLDLVTVKGQEPDQKGGMKRIVAGLTSLAKKTFKVIDVEWIRLICWRSSNFGLTTTYPRMQLLLGYSACRIMYISITAISISETLHNALWTGYKRLSNNIISGKYAIGEVSSHDNKHDRDGRGSVVAICKIAKGPKHLTMLTTRSQQTRSYTTRSGRKKLAPVVELHKDFRILAKHWMVCHQDKSKIFKDLRGLLKLEGIWFAAYVKLKRNQGSSTPGPDMLTINTLTKKRILEIRDVVLKGKFEWIGTKEVLIPKPGKPGKTRPLGIPAINDRLVQEVIRTIIEPIFELNFSDLSHGFRPNRGCHTALKWMNTHMKDAIWFVEGDIKSYFPSVDHNTLMELIQKRVTDPKICQLIRTGLKAKVFTKDKKEYVPELGTPQGGILSPLLSNIYLHEFDKYIANIIDEYAKTSCKPRRNPAIEKYYKNKLKSEIYRLRIPYYDPKDVKHLKVSYVRYADDFLIGVTGSRKMADKLRNEAAIWLKDTLKVELSKEKTLVTHISKGISFLGYVFRKRTLFTKQTYGSKVLTRRMRIPIWDVNMKRVIKRLVEAGFCDGSGFPVPAFKYLQFPQSETNQKVNYILQGLSTWWSIAGNRKRAIARLSYIIRSSIAKMYAAKFRLKTAAAVFKIGGNDLGKPLGNRLKSVIGVDESETPKNALVGIKFADYPQIPGGVGNKTTSKWKPEYVKSLEENRNSEELITTLWKEGLSKSRSPLARLGARLKYTLSSQGAPCAVCGSTDNVQMHHTHPVKDLKEKDYLKKHIMAINIKQIPLCRVHHLEAHQGNWRSKPKTLSRSKYGD